MKQRLLQISNCLLLAVCLGLTWILYAQRKSVAVAERSSRVSEENVAPNRAAAVEATPYTEQPNPSIKFNVGVVSASTHSLPQPAKYPSLKEILREHPEYAGVLKRQNERFLLSRYEPGIDSLHLSPEVAAKLRELLIEKNYAANDAADVAQTDGIEPGSPLFGKAVTGAKDEVDAEISNLIGPDGLRALYAADDLESFKHIVRGLSPAFLMAGEGLTAQQSADLAQAWYSTNNPTANPNATGPGFKDPDPVTQLNQGDQLLLAKAAQTLSAKQLSALRQYLKDQNIQKTVMASYRHK